MKFYKKSTLNLSKKDIHEIIYLKNTHWKFGYSGIGVFQCGLIERNWKRSWKATCTRTQ